MADDFKVELKVEKKGTRTSIDELSEDFFIGGEPDMSKSVQDNLTVVELEEK